MNSKEIKTKNNILVNTLNSAGIYALAFLFFAGTVMLTSVISVDTASNMRYICLGICGLFLTVDLVWNFNKKDLYRDINFSLGVIIVTMFAIGIYTLNHTI